MCSLSLLYTDRKKLKEWMRLNETQAARELDGLSYDVIGAPNMPSWISRPIVSLMLNAAMQNRSDMKKLQSSPFIAAFDGQDDMAGWIETGRRLERFLLIATSHNIACAFINQPCVGNQPLQLCQFSFHNSLRLLCGIIFCIFR